MRGLYVPPINRVKGSNTGRREGRAPLQIEPIVFSPKACLVDPVRVAMKLGVLFHFNPPATRTNE